MLIINYNSYHGNNTNKDKLTGVKDLPSLNAILTIPGTKTRTKFLDRQLGLFQ